jgi:CRISPR-associated protein Csm4
VKRYEIIIKPVSGFGTPLKGDTLFGQFCWQASYDVSLLNGGLDKWLDVYSSNPFAVFSSAVPRLVLGSDVWYVLRRPDFPVSWFYQDQSQDRSTAIDARKNIKKARWLAVKSGPLLDWKNAELWTDSHLQKQCQTDMTSDMQCQLTHLESVEFETIFSQPHNSINRLTGTTGTGMFAPYVKTIRHYYPETRLAIFALVDEDATDIERICRGLERIGAFGFGRDASTGLGRFNILKSKEIELTNPIDANACYMLGPSVPLPDSYKNAWFSPFVRFGRHGDRLATSRNPFKNPVIMADEAAVFQPADQNGFTRPYFGTAVKGVSKAQPNAVTQGYAPYLPFRLEAIHERNIPLCD